MRFALPALALALGMAGSAYAQTSAPASSASPSTAQTPATTPTTAMPATTPTTATPASGSTTAPTSTPSNSAGQGSLIYVNLQNVRINIAQNANISLDNVPIAIQVPISIAANICGVGVTTLQGQTTCNAVNAGAATQALQSQLQ